MVRNFLPQNITAKTAYIFIWWHLRSQYWLGIAKLKNVLRLTINPSTNIIWNFQMSCLTEFSMTDRLMTYLLMPSDKCYSIMAIATGLIFFTKKHCLYVFLPTAAAPMLASWFYQSLPLLSFVLHSFLHYCIGDDLRYMLQCETWRVQSWQGLFLCCYSLLGMLPKVFKVDGNEA